MRSISWLIGGLLAAGVLWLAFMPPLQGVLGSYSTSLTERSGGQRDNALRAARALDGVVIPPGQTLSFNQTVGPWTADRGYVKAPVSFSGDLVPAWGGGVCQTSTTLYNAALIAGLEVVQRQRHLWPPTYVPPGQDAAVAQYDIDLRLRNPYRWPVRVAARVSDDRIGFALTGRATGPMAEVTAGTRAVVPPRQILHGDQRLPVGERHILNPGRPGVRVSVYRAYLKGRRAGERELVSQDTYHPMNRIVRVGVR